MVSRRVKPIRSAAGSIFLFTLFFVPFLCPVEGSAQAAYVKIFSDEAGSRLLVDGKGFMINGMNWDYYPIGTNFNYSLWNQPDDIIRAALDNEMLL